MTEFTTISLILLGLVLIDSAGDAFRFKGYQIISHSAEVVQIGGWITLWALFGFDWQFIVMYIVGRIVLFDITWNLITGHNILYMGENDLVGIGIRAFARLVKQDYRHFSFIIKFLAALVWIAGIINQSIF